MKLFDVAKVGCYLESITHSTEKRKGGEVKVLQLSLRVEPFDAKLATALAHEVRTTLFKLNTAEAQPHLRKVHFGLGVERQTLTVFATTDTVKASIAFDQVRIGDVYARTSKDARGYALVFKAIFGPPGARELEYAEQWRNGMAFVSFEPSEPSEDFTVEPSDDDEDDDDATDQPRLPAAEFETDADGKEITAAGETEPVRQRTLSHTDKARKKSLH